MIVSDVVQAKKILRHYTSCGQRGGGSIRWSVPRGRPYGLYGVGGIVATHVAGLASSGRAISGGQDDTRRGFYRGTVGRYFNGNQMVT